MKVTIKGITDSTIAFNTLGIIIRGNSNKNDSGSCAYHIDIDTVDKQNEINCLVNAKFITVESEEPIEQKKPVIEVCGDNPFDIVPVVLSNEQKKQKIEEFYDNSQDTVFVDSDDGIEDCQATESLTELSDADIEYERKAYEDEYIEACEDLTNDIDLEFESETDNNSVQSESDLDQSSETDSPLAKVKGKRGRPKGSKNVKKKEIVPEVKKAITPKKITKSSAVGLKDGSDVVVMTADGPRSGQMKRNAIGDINESEATKASIDAMEELEKEERESKDSEPIDESTLDLSERMGLKAVVSCGEGSAQSVSMKNSVIPEAEQIKDRGVNFIDDAQPENEESVLIDENDADNDDGLDFLEY
jgi:hypothetical protein